MHPPGFRRSPPFDRQTVAGSGHYAYWGRERGGRGRPVRTVGSLVAVVRYPVRGDDSSIDFDYRREAPSNSAWS